MLERVKIQVGDSITIQKMVNTKDTALNYGSGKVDTLLATPSLVALMIEASVKAIDEKLPEGFVTVGTMAKIVHENPTILGATISVKVEVAKFDGQKITLDMMAYDEIGLVGKGTHERTIVNKEALQKKAMERAERIHNKNF